MRIRPNDNIQPQQPISTPEPEKAKLPEQMESVQTRIKELIASDAPEYLVQQAQRELEKLQLQKLAEKPPESVDTIENANSAPGFVDTTDPMYGKHLAEVPRVTDATFGSVQDFNFEGKKKSVDKMLNLVMDGRNFQQQWGFTDTVWQTFDSNAKITLQNAKESADASMKAFDNAEKHLQDARQALVDKNPSAYEDAMLEANRWMQTAHKAQSNASDIWGMKDDLKANGAKFIRDSAIETEIALLSIYFGGAGGVAGKFGQASTKLAQSHPVAYQLLNSIGTSAATEMPKLLSAYQDARLAGKSQAGAWGDAILQVGTNTLFGVAGDALGWGAQKTFPMFAKAVKEKAGPLLNELRKHLPEKEFTGFMQKFETQMKDFYNQKIKPGVETLAEKTKPAREYVATGQLEADLLRKMKADKWHPNGWVRDTLRQGGPAKLYDQAAFHNGTLTHSKELEKILGPQVKGHDLVGPGKKTDAEIRRALSSRVNLDDLSKQFQKIGKEGFDEILGDLGNKVVKTRDGKTLSLSQFMTDKGFRGFPTELVEDGTLDQVVNKLKRSDNLSPKLKKDVGEAGDIVRAQHEHNKGALHHVLWDEMDKYKNVEEFLKKVDDGLYLKNPATGEIKKITEEDVMESALDIVNARRDVQRPYQKGKQPATIDDLRGNPVQKEFLDRAFSLHNWAEQMGLVRPFGENAVASRLRSAWVYATKEAGQWLNEK